MGLSITQCMPPSRGTRILSRLGLGIGHHNYPCHVKECCFFFTKWGQGIRQHSPPFGKNMFWDKLGLGIRHLKVAFWADWDQLLETVPPSGQGMFLGRLELDVTHRAPHLGKVGFEQNGLGFGHCTLLNVLAKCIFGQTDTLGIRYCAPSEKVSF